MRRYTYYKSLVFYCLIAIAALCALGLFSNINIPDNLSENFSANRVAEDIKVISKDPHSIQHPKNRKVVKEYLFHRLQQMGGDVKTFEYDSIKCKFGGYFDIENIYSVFDPVTVTDSTQYVLLVAHYDSRFFQIVKKDTVYSHGAADDGYGLGVILEQVRVALNYRENWKQGIKVLFTDSEEHELDGMVNMREHNPSVLQNVNFVINVEARGVKGPAFLFETSNNNSKIVDLYSLAQQPHSFSLTTVVYRFLPNDTDFTVVKDSYPGMNFSVIDNLHYYHTNLDNYSNISLESLQHYGMALEPIMSHYLTDEAYSNSRALVSDSDSVFFTLPLFGLFVFSKGEYLVLNLLAVLLTLIILFVFVKYARLSLKQLFKTVGLIFVSAVIALLSGILISYLLSVANGLDFSLTDVRYVTGDSYIMVGIIALLVLCVRFVTRVKSKKNRNLPLYLFVGAIIVAQLLSLVMHVAIGENFFLLIPLIVLLVSALLGVVSWFKYLHWISAAFTVFVSLYFLKILYIALTIGFAGVILFLATIYLFMVISQFYIIKRNLI